jgi:hypothetical protein
VKRRHYWPEARAWKKFARSWKSVRRPITAGKQYGGAKEETVRRLKELEKENGRLKRIVADMALDNAMLKELNEGKW